MLDSGNIMLCFLSGEQNAIDIASQYWACDSQRHWLKTVQEIADNFGIRKHKVPDRVRRFALAFDLNERCAQCYAPRLLTTRGDAMQARCYTLNFVCEECRATQAEATRLATEEKNRAEKERLGNIFQRLREEVRDFDYTTIGYLDAIVAYAIMLASETAISNGRVGDPHHLMICPSDSLLADLLGRLRNHRILVFANDTPITAISPESVLGGRVSYFPLMVSWQFAPPTGGNSFADVFREIGHVVEMRTEHPEFLDSVSELWWMLSEDEAIRYLREQLSTYQLTDLQVGDKLSEAITYALSRFSIPKLRYLLQRVAKNAAAFSTRTGITRRHALNIIPGNIIRDCDRALADSWSIKPYCLKWDQEEAQLTTLLFDRILGTGIEGFRSMTGEAVNQMAA